MNSSKITIQKLYKEDDFFEILFSAENNHHKTTVMNYIGVEKLVGFCKDLQKFPFIQSEVTFSSGENSNSSFSFLFLRAYLYDRLGHAGFEIKTRTNGAPFVASECHFTISTEVASINALAGAMLEWLASNDGDFEFSLYSGLH